MAKKIRAWVSVALDALNRKAVLLTVRLVDDLEMQKLNKKFRDRLGSTNVLSFPFQLPPGLPELTPTELGDIVVCLPQVKREAFEQSKTVEDHLAHIIVHGVLHLNGFDHHHIKEEKEMQYKERKILESFNISDPY